MKKIFLLIPAIAFLLLSCNQNTKIQDKNSSQEKTDENLIEKPQLKLTSDIMTPEVLWSFGRLSDVQVSPDKTKLLYGVTYYSKEQNKGNRELYTINTDGSEKKQLTHSASGEYNAVWSKNGDKIYYLSAKNGSMQIWEMNADGSNKHQISDIDGDVTGFGFSPDYTKLFYTKEVQLDTTASMKYPDLDKTTGRIITDLMFRHWDTFVDTYSHVFVSNFDGNKIKEGTDLLEGEKYECPMKPFGGIEQIAFTADSKKLAYTCRKKHGLAYAISTNSDIYLYDTETGKTENLTEGMMGYDVNPVFSPDGKYMAWESMERDGYESDKNRLFVMDLQSGEKKYLTKDFDQNVHSLAWADDSKNIYFISDWHATDEIYKINIDDNKISKLTEGIHNYRTVAPLGNGKLIATRVSMSKPNEIYKVDENTGKAEEISFENKDILSQLTMGDVKKRWVETTDGKQMLVWFIYPPHFDSTKVYPALLYCQGGPQGTVSQFWSYRWNFQMMAANGYIVVAPNRRGLPGFGQEWNEQISGDYGGQNMKDYLSAIDNAKKEPYIDENRLGAVGASYGGFSVYWLAGHHNKRFKAFIAHDGMFNLEAQYLETEEMWFVNWDLGGAFWDKNNKIAQRSYENSPHKFVQNWDTPIMIIHGGKDYRILDSQGFSAFTAAKLRGIPAKMLYFPDENHWVLRPQNGILWQREFFAWLDKWLK